ncbi:hypothetical protein [Sinomonas sp. R1AF57]|uniref:hypothetical protein n=1 Tax=Sinomonas sp. R1AF57 TaxID=2020377 RepID=UPI000B611525|nr:hypothetical protein [Sinomonas sp. R1AF57]ASN52504.1 hypothetical protein CGQ25_10805 [Sinomonas sp. R1AF57]
MIYGLHGGDGVIRYVGQSKAGIAGRLSGHRGTARAGSTQPVHTWMREAGIESVVAVTLHEVPEGASMDDAEAEWIARSRAEYPDVNLNTVARSTTREVTAVERARRSARAKAMWADPEAKEKLTKAIGEAMSRPESRERVSEASKAMWADPEARARQSEAARANWTAPEYRARISEASKALWTDPEHRARMREAARAQMADPAVRARLSEASKANWTAPEYRARISESAKAQWADPEFRARVDEALERGRHTRWHTNRGIRKPGCEFCQKSPSRSAESPQARESRLHNPTPEEDHHEG